MPINLGSVTKRIEDIGSTTGDDRMVRRAGISLGDINKANDAIERATGWTVDITDGIIEGGLEIDASGSMSGEYGGKRVQAVAERVTAFYAITDANGKFPVGFFGSEATKPKELTLRNYKGWVANNVPRRLTMTNLFDAIYTGAEMAADALKCKDILRLVKHRKSGWDKDQVTWDVAYRDLRPVGTPKIFHLTIITDGAPTVGPRERYIRELITRLSFCGIFIKFIFIGSDRDGEKFLDDLDDMKTRWHADDPRPEDVHDDGWQQELRYIDNVDKVKFLRGLGNDDDETFDTEFSAAMSQELDSFLPSSVKRQLLLVS